MKKAIIFDIDGVLAKISKNEDGTPKRGYRDYDKVDLDEKIKIISDLRFMCQEFYGYSNGYCANKERAKEFDFAIIYVTGRKELCREKTEQFLHLRYEEQKRLLFMRPDNDHRKAVELKKEIYETQIKGNYDVVMAFDDDPEVCKMYKEQGILTLQVMTRE